MVGVPNRKQVRDPATQARFDEFGRRLQAHMDRLGWSQSDLARHCAQNMPRPAKGQIQNLDFGRDRISHYVRGISMPRAESLAVIAKTLGVEQVDLVPPLAVPPTGGAGPAFEIRSAGGDRVSLSINHPITMATATKIVELLNTEPVARRAD
jgi:transcriptional regulator with XRE-family HTH domain